MPHESLYAVIVLTAVAYAPVLACKLAWAQAGVWQEYRREDLGFRIEMPGNPTTRIEQADLADNWISSISAQVRHGHEVFNVSWTQFKDVASVDAEYTRFRKMMAEAGYQILEEVPSPMNALQARDFIIETGDINFVRRIMAVRTIVIGLHAMGARNIYDSPTTRRFFEFVHASASVTCSIWHAHGLNSCRRRPSSSAHSRAGRQRERRLPVKRFVRFGPMISASRQ